MELPRTLKFTKDEAVEKLKRILNRDIGYLAVMVKVITSGFFDTGKDVILTLNDSIVVLGKQAYMRCFYSYEFKFHQKLGSFVELVGCTGALCSRITFNTRGIF